MSNNAASTGKSNVSEIPPSSGAGAPRSAGRVSEDVVSGDDGNSGGTSRGYMAERNPAEILTQFGIPTAVGRGNITSVGDIPDARNSRYVPAGNGQDRPLKNLGVEHSSFARPPMANSGGGGIRAIYEPGSNSGTIIPKRVRVNRAKFDYERDGAADTVVLADREDRMPDVKAAEVLAQIHAEFALSKESAEILKAFDDAMFLYVALNQTSSINNARAGFQVHGVHFEFARVLRVVGPFPRKFFRAYADEIRDVINRILLEETINDDLFAMAESIRQTAFNRGMSRYPSVCFDVADHCSDLSAAERAAVRASANAVISGTPNRVDEVKVSRPVSGESDDE